MKNDNYSKVFRSQRIFRSLIDAFSHPFRVCSIEDSADTVKELCSVLLDNEVSFYVDDDCALASEIKEMTYAKVKDIDLADYIIITDPHKFDMFDKIRQGTLANPHEGATVIISMPRLKGNEEIVATGPGIDGELLCCVDERISYFLDKAKQLNIEYPKGFEMLFAAPGGEMLAAPRRAKISRRNI